MRIEALKFLYDIQQACRAVAQFTAGKTLADYEADLLLRSGVERQLMIVGEALSRLMKIEPAVGSTITAARQIIGFRNILVHGYDVIRDREVWKILEDDLPALAREVDALLKQGDDELAAAEET